MTIEVKLPKMGESITEATIINWQKACGDFIHADEVLLEVATDKVDNEVPAPCSGVITAIFFQKDEVVTVGDVIALVDTTANAPLNKPEVFLQKNHKVTPSITQPQSAANPNSYGVTSSADVFLSPLVVAIAQQEHMSIEELKTIQGTGKDGRIRKSDVFQYLKNRKYPIQSIGTVGNQAASSIQNPYGFVKPAVDYNPDKDRLIEMDRMRRLIAGHMVYSKQTAPHVTTYLEVDVTGLVAFRETTNQKRVLSHKQKRTFTPFFIDAVAKAIKDFPLINVSVDGDRIVVHAAINIGMATALPSGNLIVPVVKNAHQKDLDEIADEVNRLADQARNNQLSPDDVKGSTFTISNVGTFGSIMGTPIINQPEAAIVAFGIIKKRPEVISTPNGDEIAIRSMLFLSLSFDHRIIDGYLAGSFLRKLGDYLESYNTIN